MRKLTFYDRQRIEFYLHFKRLTIRRIAQLIGRDHSVVSREIKNHKPQPSPYNAELAQKAAKRKARITNKRKLDKDQELLRYVSEKLKEDWSPEQVAGRLKQHPPPKLKGLTISYEQIYQYAYNQGQAYYSGEYLYTYLPQRKPKRTKRGSRKTRKISIPQRVSISQRPEEANQKLVFGHWEADVMFCLRRKGLAVQYERSSKLLRIQRLETLKAEDNLEAILTNIESLPSYLWKTITFDNGKENVKHIELRDSFNIQTYFCDPYKAWQKGGVENMNGLLRRYLPKKTNLETIINQELYQIQERLNNRPRKSLNYQTPNEILRQQGGALNS